MTNRLKKVMHRVVHQDQTCGVPGCSCTWNLLVTRDVLDWAEERNLPVALVSIDQEKAFDRVQHGFLFGVLERMGLGPRFTGWIRTLYRQVYSVVRVNGFLSGAVEQAGGVRQGCPLSPLLYVLFMEPFAELVRQDPGIDGILLPGAAGVRLRIQQYADDTTLFVSSEASLRRVRQLVDLFAAGTGSKVNMGKSSVLLGGCWKEEVRDFARFNRCEGGLKILGVKFFPRDSARLNWEVRLTVVRACLGRWASRRMSLSGRVMAVRVVLLPLLLHLGYVFPAPAAVKLALTRAVFRFLWGGSYEYVSREQMYLPVAKGGRDVPRVPLKLDVLYSSFACRCLLQGVQHKCFYFVRLYLAFALRRLAPLSHVVPRAESLTAPYKAVVTLLRKRPSLVEREVLLDHRAWYRGLTAQMGAPPPPSGCAIRDRLALGERWEGTGRCEGSALALRTRAAAGAGDLTSARLLAVIRVPQGLWAGGICGTRLLGMPLCSGVLGIGAGFVVGGEVPDQFVKGFDPVPQELGSPWAWGG